MNTIETLKELLKLAHESLDSKDVEIAELKGKIFKQSQESKEEVSRAIEIILEKDDKIAELEKELAGYKQVAKERAEFIINGEELGYISLPESENDKAYLTFMRCQLTDEYAAIEALKEQD
jgi:hypothetical protein